MSKKSFYAKAINIEIMNLYVEGKFINSGFEILTDSLEQGPYYIIVDVADRMELWSINSQKPLSDKLDYIYIQDLSEKNHYYVGMKNNKEAIFHKDDKDNPVSGWHDWIPAGGLINGESDYYLADDNDKYSIFHKDDKDNPVSERYNTFDEAKQAMEDLINKSSDPEDPESASPGM